MEARSPSTRGSSPSCPSNPPPPWRVGWKHCLLGRNPPVRTNSMVPNAVTWEKGPCFGGEAHQRNQRRGGDCGEHRTAQHTGSVRQRPMNGQPTVASSGQSPDYPPARTGTSRAARVEARTRCRSLAIIPWVLVAHRVRRWMKCDTFYFAGRTGTSSELVRLRRARPTRIVW